MKLCCREGGIRELLRGDREDYLVNTHLRQPIISSTKVLEFECG
jgi:hypothetical protein